MTHLTSLRLPLFNIWTVARLSLIKIKTITMKLSSFSKILEIDFFFFLKSSVFHKYFIQKGYIEPIYWIAPFHYNQGKLRQKIKKKTTSTFLKPQPGRVLLNHLHSKMLCAKSAWIWHRGSGEEAFEISTIHFRYFVIIKKSTLGKGRGRLNEEIWIPFTNICFVLTLLKSKQ